MNKKKLLVDLFICFVLVFLTYSGLTQSSQGWCPSLTGPPSVYVCSGHQPLLTILRKSSYLSTLNRPWLFYDERMIEDETFLPIPASFKEIGEIISSFGISNNLGSSNFLYSSNQVNRFNMFAVPLALFVFHAFQKNIILYHLFLISLHLLNTFLVYFLIHIVNYLNALTQC